MMIFCFQSHGDLVVVIGVIFKILSLLVPFIRRLKWSISTDGGVTIDYEMCYLVFKYLLGPLLIIFPYLVNTWL